jgi:hypothetical protein
MERAVVNERYRTAYARMQNHSDVLRNVGIWISAYLTSDADVLVRLFRNMFLVK